MDLIKQYQQRCSEFQTEFQNNKRVANIYAASRVFVFLVAIIVAIILINMRDLPMSLAVLFIGVVGFIVLLKKHNHFKHKRDLAEKLKSINENEIQRMKFELSAFSGGPTEKTSEHNYAEDIDILGKNSVFQMLTACSTPIGENVMADWLLNAGNKNQILERQEAVRELTQEIDWRQSLQAYSGMFPHSQKEVENLSNYLTQPAPLKGYLKIIRYGLPLLNTLAIAAWIIGFSNLYPIATLVASGYFLKQVFEQANQVTKNLYKGIATLKSYSKAFGLIEQSEFSAKKLLSLQLPFSAQNKKASKEIAALQNILDNLLARGNIFHAIFNLTFLLDIQWLLALEKWKAKYGEDVPGWFNALGEFEGLSSMAGFAYANPEYVFPTIADTKHKLEVANMGHPLIPLKDRINNDFNLTGTSSIAVVTGSNMSGKSTFLRTLGVNITLALSGSVVAAKEFELSVMQLFSSMRTQDSLGENVSSFYAELQRIEKLIALVAKGQPIIFLLDEILKGTNSEDRNRGARALIKQLAEAGASGLVSTHDVALGSLADSGSGITNYNFSSSISGDKILFDYKINPGVCKSFNASKLMQMIGIKIETK